MSRENYVSAVRGQGDSVEKVFISLVLGRKTNVRPKNQKNPHLRPNPADSVTAGQSQDCKANAPATSI